MPEMSVLLYVAPKVTGYEVLSGPGHYTITDIEPGIYAVYVW